MYFPRSLPALTFLMSLSIVVEALVSYPRLTEDAIGFINPHFEHGNTPPRDFEKRQDTQDLECPNDRWQEMLDHNPPDRVVTFCNEWLGIGPATKVVEWTPTITVTTSAASTTTTTSTTRTIRTKTTTQTVTTTLAPIVQRAANLAAVAEDIIHSVIASGTTEAEPMSKNSQRLMAESGFANACSCKMVDPTATVTSSFTVPPVYTTVGYRKIVRVTTTDTKVFTAFTTLNIIQGQTLPDSTSGPASTGTVFPSLFDTTNVSSIDVSPSSSALASSVTSSTVLSSSTDSSSSASSTQSESITGPVALTALFTGSSLSASSSSVSSLPVVTAIPFSCPEAADQRVDQVVGDYRLDYLVLCNTELRTEDRVGRPIPVESETSCAAQCSLVNAQSGQDTCQAASFQPYTDGRRGGTCTLSGSETEYIDKPGSVAVVHTGTFSNGDDCRDLNSTASPSRSIDTSALISSITAASFSLSTPGLVTQSAEGGIFQTKVSANSTDSNGAVHWSWYDISASSSYWWAVYSTSWECTTTISRTIVQQPAEPSTITEIMITTIINGATTTIISGTSTRVFTKGEGGISPPTFVPASTTEGNGEFTTWFSLATQASTGASGVVPTSSIGSSSTGVFISTVRNADNLTVSGGTSTFFSTGGAGISSPSPSNSTIAVSATSPGLPTSNVTSSAQWTGEIGGYGSLSSLLVYPSNSTMQTGTAQTGVWTSAGSILESTLTGTAGVIIPTAATGTTVFSNQSTLAISSSGVLTNTSLSILTLAETLVWTTAGSTATTFQTGASGVISHVPSMNSSFITMISVTSSVLVLTADSSTFTSNVTGDSGVTVPTSATSIRSFSNEIIPTLSSTQSRGNLSITGSVLVTSTSAGSGVTSPPTGQSFNISLSTFNQSASSTGTISSTFSTSAPSIASLSSANASSATSIGPDILFTSMGGTRVFSTQGSTAVTVVSSDHSIISPTPSSNSTLPTPTSVTPDSNFTLPTSTGPPFTNSDQDRTRGFHSSSTRTSLASTDAIVPPLNASVPTFPASTSQPVSVASTTQTGPPFSNSDRPRTGGFNASSSSVGTPSKFILLTSSSIALPSLTPSQSLNTSSTSTGLGFSNSDRPRTGSFNLTTSSASVVPPSATPSSNNSTTSTSVPFSNSDLPRTPNFNSTSTESERLTVASVTLSLSVNASTTSASSASSGVPSRSINSTSALLASTSSSVVSTSSPSTSGASSGLPPISINSTSTMPIPTATASANTTSSASVSLSINSTTLSSMSSGSRTASLPTPSANTTISTSSGSISSGKPTASSNLTAITPQFPNSTIATGSGFTVASVSIPTNSLNSSMTIAQTTNVTSLLQSTSSVRANITTSFVSSIPSAGPSASVNATTAPSVFPENSTSRPSATPTPWLNSTTTSDTCPTAAVILTVTSVQMATSIQLQTVTVVQTQIQMVTIDTAPTLTSDSPTPSPSSPSGLEARLRRAGEPATQEQIDAACADANNLVLNPDYAAGDNGPITGWSSDTSDPTITVSSEQTPSGNSTMAEFKSALVGRSLAITQPLVLCPKQQYTLSALNRQANTLSKCTLTYVVGDDSVFTVTPQEAWLPSSAFFTAGEGANGASVDLKIMASCAGYGGLPVADQDGWMRVEVGGISVVRDVGR